MVGSFLITLREGIEAALILGIILGYLSKIRQNSLKKNVYYGVGYAFLLSILLAYIFKIFSVEFEGMAEQLFEGIVMLLAVVLITSMILWMQKQSKNLKGNLAREIDMVIENNSPWGIIVISFISVFREGVEIVLFLQASLTQSSAIVSFVGASLGLMAAVILAYFIFKTSIKLDLKKFFKITGGLLIFISAGLLAQSIHELQEAHILPVIIEHLYDINGIINEKGTFGSFLKAMFGYNGNPSLLEVISYIVYIVGIGKLFFVSTTKDAKSNNF